MIFLIEMAFLSAIILFSVTALKTLIELLAHYSRYRAYMRAYPLGSSRGRVWQFTK